ncbi:MAG: flagellar biosynthetic protein FliO [Phycisphaerae bacterium]|nr:flagellar biosynthetic protein FliO [Phycisphaerae bacterium]
MRTWLAMLVAMGTAVVAIAADGDPVGVPEVRVVANRSSVSETEAPASEAVVDEVAVARPSEARPIWRSGQPSDEAVLQAGGGRRSSSWSRARDLAGGLLPMLAVLVIMTALLVVAKRLLPAHWRTNLARTRMIDVLGRQHLSPKQSVALLKVGRRVVLVGLTADRVSHLETITDPDEVAELIGRSASGKPGSLTMGFERDVLREASAYEPGRPHDLLDHTEASDRMSAYLGARQQVRGLLHRVRALAGSA